MAPWRQPSRNGGTPSRVATRPPVHTAPQKPPNPEPQPSWNATWWEQTPAWNCRRWWDTFRIRTRSEIACRRTCPSWRKRSRQGYRRRGRRGRGRRWASGQASPPFVRRRASWQEVPPFVWWWWWSWSSPGHRPAQTKQDRNGNYIIKLFYDFVNIIHFNLALFFFLYQN